MAPMEERMKTDPSFSPNHVDPGLHRFNRAVAPAVPVPDSKFHKSIPNFESLARISTAISLQMGLIDGTIPADEAIAELLRIGALKLSDITGIDGNSVSNALDLLPNDGQGMTELERWLKSLDQIRVDSKGIMDFGELPKKVEFQNRLVDVENIKNLDNSTLEAWRGEIDSAGSILTQINRASGNLNANQAEGLFDRVTLLGKNLDKIHSSASNYTTNLQLLTKAKEIETYSDFYEIFTKEYDIRNRLDSLPKGTSVNDFKSSIQNIYSVRDSIKTPNSIDTLRKLTQSRKPFFHQTFHYAAGFPFGYADLQKLYQDSMNQWILKRIDNGTLVSDGLKRAFTAYNDLKTELEQIEKVSWKGLKDDSVDKILTAQFLISTLPSDVAKATSALDGIDTCTTAKTNPSKPFEESKLTNTKKLNEDLKKLSTLGYADDKFLNALKQLKDLLPTDANPQDKIAAAKEYVNRMKASASFGLVMKTLERLKTDIDYILTTSANISDLVAKVNSELTEIMKYHEEVVKFKPYFEFFNCLKEEDTKLTKQIIQSIQNSRVDSKNLATAKTIITDIISSKNALNSAKEKAEGFKKIKNREAILFREAVGDNVNYPFNDIGMGVQGLVAIKMAFDAKSGLNPLLALANDVVKDSGGLSKKDQEALKKLKELPEIFKNVDGFVRGSKKRSSGFKDTHKIFEDASNLKGVEIDIPSLREAIESLRKSVPNKYDAIPTQIDILEPLDLNFARFKIKDAIPALIALDTFLTSFAVLMSKPAPAGSQYGPGSQGNQAVLGPLATADNTNIFAECWDWFMSQEEWMKALIGVGAIGGLVALIGGIIFAIRCCKKTLSEDEMLLMSSKVASVIRTRVEEGSSPFLWAEGMFLSMRECGVQMVTGEEKEHEEDRRYPDHYCNPETMSKIKGFDDNFINSNMFEVEKGVIWHIAQGPQYAKPPSVDANGKTILGKNNTIEKHWALIEQNKIKVCIQLCQFVEGPNVKCAEYYPLQVNGTSTYGRYEVKTLEIQENLDPVFTDVNDFVLYKLEYTNTKTEKTKNVDILLYKGWPDHSAPSSPDPCLQMINFADSYKSPVLVHCSAGVGRSGTLVAIKYGINYCQKKRISCPTEVIQPVRKARFGAVQSGKQILLTVVAITKGICVQNDFGLNENYFALEYYLSQAVKKKYEKGPYVWEEDEADKGKHVEKNMAVQPKKKKKKTKKGQKKDKKKDEKKDKKKEKKSVTTSGSSAATSTGNSRGTQASSQISAV